MCQAMPTRFSCKFLRPFYLSRLQPNKRSFLPCFRKAFATRSAARVVKAESSLTPVAEYLKEMGVPIGVKSSVPSASLTFATFSLDESKKVISSLRHLGFSERAVIEMISARPYILRVSAQDIRQRFRTLKEHLATPLEITEQELLQLLERQAYVLGSLHTPRRIQEKLTFLGTLGLSMKDIRKIATMDARFTLVDMEANMKTTVSVLQQLGLTDAEVGHIVRSAPGILGNIRETPRTRIAFFSHEFGWSKPEIAESLIAFPPLLRNDIMSMKLKHEIMKFVGYSSSEIRSNVYAFAYSLRKIYFRLLFIKAINTPRDRMMTVHSYMVVPLEPILKRHRVTADQFEKFVTKNERNLLESKKTCSVVVDLELET